MKEYQVNVRTEKQLEHLSVYAKSEKKALELARNLYSDYQKHKFVKTYKILNIVEIRKVG